MKKLNHLRLVAALPRRSPENQRRLALAAKKALAAVIAAINRLRKDAK